VAPGDHVLLAIDEAELVQLSICWRLIEGWKEKSKLSRVFTTGSREERKAAFRRRLFRKLRRL
jgi:hypothetical protein